MVFGDEGTGLYSVMWLGYWVEEEDKGLCLGFKTGD